MLYLHHCSVLIRTVVGYVQNFVFWILLNPTKALVISIYTRMLIGFLRLYFHGRPELFPNKHLDKPYKLFISTYQAPFKDRGWSDQGPNREEKLWIRAQCDGFIRVKFGPPTDFYGPSTDL